MSVIWWAHKGPHLCGQDHAEYMGVRYAMDGGQLKWIVGGVKLTNLSFQCPSLAQAPSAVLGVGWVLAVVCL